MFIALKGSDNVPILYFDRLSIKSFLFIGAKKALERIEFFRMNKSMLIFSYVEVVLS